MVHCCEFKHQDIIFVLMSADHKIVITYTGCTTAINKLRDGRYLGWHMHFGSTSHCGNSVNCSSAHVGMMQVRSVPIGRAFKCQYVVFSPTYSHSL